MHNIAHDIQYIPIFDILIQFKLCRYCITGLMYHDMAIYQYIVASLIHIHIYIHTYTYRAARGGEATGVICPGPHSVGFF